jgi:GT2 family glycosyltransferase
MGIPLVTVAIVPRERFSLANESLDNILATTSSQFEILYVDGNSPADVRDHVASQAQAHGFRVLRHETYLSPNQARNMAARHARTKYIVFIDNDVLVSPGWLEALVDCAERTDAWVVGPIYCERLPLASRIHMAGGRARIVARDGRRELSEDHCHFGESLEQVRPQLKREPTEQIEFHCALVRRDVFDRVGFLDEGLWSAAEHTDLCLLARQAGGQVYLEPDSVVTYLPPPPLTAADRSYFMLRWSDAWNTASLERFRKKWRLTDEDPSLDFLKGWLARHRRIAWHRVHQAVRWLGSTPARWLRNHVIDPLETSINRRRYPTVNCHAPIAQQRGATAADTVRYAQTNLQLYDQLVAAGYEENSLRLVRNAHDLAMRLFAGHFRGNGKSFLSHLIGVASILATHGRSLEAVAAGLLHSVYAFGEFGDGTRGINDEKRRQVRQAVGSATESLIADYAMTDWNPGTLDALAACFCDPELPRRSVFDLKMADVLEDHLDHGLCYAPAKRLAGRAVENATWCAAMSRTAVAIGCDDLEAELARWVGTDNSVPSCLQNTHGESHVVAPLSHRKRLALLLSGKFHDRRHKSRRAA